MTFNVSITNYVAFSNLLATAFDNLRLKKYHKAVLLMYFMLYNKTLTCCTTKQWFWPPKIWSFCSTL